MDRTPSISRSNSRSSLEDLSPGDSVEIEKQGSKGSTKTQGMPSDGNPASKVPSTSNRPSQHEAAWSNGYARPDSEPLGSTRPLLSSTGRKGVQANAVVKPGSRTSSTPVSSTSFKPAPSPSATSSAPVRAVKDNRVFARDLSPKVLSSLAAGLQVEAGLSPEKLGELLIAVESKGGTNKLEGDAIRRILRGALQIRDFSLPSGGSQDVNVIQKICEPFMFRHLATSAMEKARKKFVSEFDKVASQFEALAQDLPPKAWALSDRLAKLMEPVMGPVIDLICGKGNSVDSSELPDPVKKLLTSIDKQVIDWFGKNGTGKPADLLEARKSALIGFLSTRSLGYVWLTKSVEEKAIDNQRLKHLMAYMNAYVSKRLDGFVMDLLLKQPDQPVEARKYIEVLTKKSGLKSKPSVPTLNFGLAADAKILSPRRTGSLATPRSNASSSTPTKAEEKRAKEHSMKMKLERARRVDEIAKASGLPDIDYPCYQYVKDIVVNMSQRGFDHFKKDPTASFIKHADRFYAKLENHQKVKEGLPEKVRNALRALAIKMIGNPFEDDDADSAPSTVATSPRPPVLVGDDSSATEPSDETEIGTESSEEEKRS